MVATYRLHAVISHLIATTNLLLSAIDSREITHYAFVSWSLSLPFLGPAALPGLVEILEMAFLPREKKPLVERIVVCRPIGRGLFGLAWSGKLVLDADVVIFWSPFVSADVMCEMLGGERLAPSGGERELHLAPEPGLRKPFLSESRLDR